MSDARLGEFWRLRNAAAGALALAEDVVQREIRSASVDKLVTLIDTFSPARSAGPEWTRSFEPLVERLWSCRDDATMAALAAVFRGRGMPWMAVTNALSPEQGAVIAAGVRHPSWARHPALTIA